MNKKLRAFLEANGLRADASEQDAWAMYDKLTADGMEFPGIEPGTRSAAGTVPATPAPAAENRRTATPATPAVPVDVDALVRKALENDKARCREIGDRLRVAGMTDHDGGNFARTMYDDPACTIERASQLIFAEMAKRNPAVGSGAHASIGRESGEKLRAAITDGLLVRSGSRIEQPAEGYREFRGRSLVEISRELLEAQGINCRNMSRMDIAGRALASGSTSDFANIFAALVNKRLLAAYAEWPATWRPFVAMTSAMDFKDLYSIKLSGSPDLKGLTENGEYQTANFSDSKESYRVITKGIRVPLTRQMIINDDLRAFTRIPQLFGVAARRMEADAVYSLITANGNMSDGNALFSIAHKNLAGTGVALGSDSLNTCRAAMRKQTGLKGERIDVVPAFLLAPVVLETSADILLRSSALPTADMSSGVVNPWAGKLTPITDPHLDDNSATAFYLLASPSQVPTIEVAFLEGEEQPYVEEQIDFDSDALVVKVRHDFGAGVVDHVGAYKNPGAA